MFTGVVENTNDQDIDLLMGIKTPGADDLLGGKKKAQESSEEPDPADPDLELDEPIEPKAAAPKRNRIEETPAEKASKKTTDEVADELFGKEEETLDDQGKVVKKPVLAAKKVTPTDQEVDYQAVYEAFVADKVWGEVDVPEDFKWDAEGFKQIQALQSKTQYEDLLDKTGTYGKAIIEFEKNGGNPGEILTLFREQRTIQDFDVSTPEGQEDFLQSYLKAQDYSEKSIERTLKALIDQGGTALKEEAEEKKALWDTQYNEEIEQTQRQQALAASKAAEQARNFNKNISDVLTADPEATTKDRRELSNYILNYSQKFKGHDVSQFYLDMTEIQKDPTSYVELAKFIKGLKNGDYKQKIADKTKKEVSARTFMKVKNGAALTNRDGGTTPLNDGDEHSFVSYLSPRKK